MLSLNGEPSFFAMIFSSNAKIFEGIPVVCSSSKLHQVTYTVCCQQLKYQLFVLFPYREK